MATVLAGLCFLPCSVEAEDAASDPEEAPNPGDSRQPSSLLSGVRAPDGFEVKVFAAPPHVSYPTGIAAAPTGEVFVAIDKNSSLDRAPGRGSIVLCVDGDDDGVADRFDPFVADIDSPRGMCFVGDRLYVVHPPFLSAFADEDGDGTSDRHETLVRGMGFDLGFRGADHTSNGVRMGIDGWLYLAIGDYGMVEATGTDGSTLQLHGGGILRVRSDGSELELYARGLRNVYDIAVGPALDGFTRDNTNDGGGWDIRLSHITQAANFGYPTLFKNFGDEIVPPLAIHGGGSGTGALYLDEPGFPAKYGDALYTCDWGRSQVYRHDLERRGATYRSGQEEFLAIPRPTDLDVDGRSRLYVGSWKDGMYNYAGKPIGFVARVTFPGVASPAFPDLAGAADDVLVEHLASRSHVCRIHAQHEILRRGERPVFAPALEKLAAAGDAPLSARVAAIFTLKQLRGRRSHAVLLELAGHEAVREFALRALADRRDESDQVPVAPFIRALDDSNPRVRLQAVVGLGRLGRPETAAAILPLTEETDVLLRHTAVQTLVSLRAVRPCLDALVDGASSSRVDGSLRVLRRLHEVECVDGLIGKLGALRDAGLRLQILKALVRLYHTEAEWKGKWWGTRPDTRGPYYDLATWDGSARIAPVLQEAIEEGDVATTDALLGELRRHRVHLEGLSGLLLELARKENALRAQAVGMLLEERNLKPEYLEVFRDVASSSDFDVDLRREALLGLSGSSREPTRSSTPSSRNPCRGASVPAGCRPARDRGGRRPSRSSP